MWVKRKDWDVLISEKAKREEFSARLDKIEVEHNRIIAENASLQAKLANRDNKVAELMESVAHLNRDLDLWESLSDLVASIPEDEGVTLTMPKKGEYLLKKAYLE